MVLTARVLAVVRPVYYAQLVLNPQYCHWYAARPTHTPFTQGSYSCVDCSM